MANNLYERTDAVLSLQDVDTWFDVLQDMDGYRPQQRVHISIANATPIEELYKLLDKAMAWVAVFNRVKYSIDMSFADFKTYLNSKGTRIDGSKIPTEMRILNLVGFLEEEGTIDFQSNLDAFNWIGTNHFEFFLEFKEVDNGTT